MKDLRSVAPYTNEYVTAELTSAAGNRVKLGPGSIAKVEIYESIHESTFHGIITLFDQNAIREQLPIRGQETVEIEWKKEGTEFSCRGYITSIEGGIIESGASYFTLYFTSVLEAANSSTIFSRAYKGLTSTIIEKIVGEVDISTVVSIDTPSSRSINYILPYKRPLSACHDLIANSYDINSSPLVMFQTFDGVVHIDSITNLHNKVSFGSFNDWPVSKTNDPAQMLDDSRLNKYNTLAVTNAYDIQKKAENGAYSSTTVSYDISKKSYNRVNAYDSGKLYLSANHKFGNGEYTYLNVKNKQFLQRSNALSFESLNNVRTYAPETLSKRAREWENSDVIRAGAILNPRPGLHAGMTIELDVDSALTLLQGVESVNGDTQLQGKYLISYACHVITSDRYEMSVELIKSGGDE